MDCQDITSKKILFYGIVGVIGTVVHFSTLVILVELFNIGYILSSSIGFVLTVILSFILNMKYTFKVKDAKRLYYFIKYLSTSLIGLGLNSLIMYFSVEILYLHYFIGQTMVIMIIPATNFLINNYWTFK